MRRQLAKVFLFTLSLVFFNIASAASGGGDHDTHQIPWGMIIPQVVNFSIVVGLLYYLLKKTVIEHFKGRADEFTQKIKKARQALTDAEDQKRVISERLQKLQSNASTDIEKAKSEAESLRAKILKDAEVLSQRMQSDSERSAGIELERAKNKLRLELLRKSVDLAQKTLVDKVDAPVQKRLRSEFVEKIQVVQ